MLHVWRKAQEKTRHIFFWKCQKLIVTQKQDEKKPIIISQKHLLRKRAHSHTHNYNKIIIKTFKALKLKSFAWHYIWEFILLACNAPKLIRLSWPIKYLIYKAYVLARNTFQVFAAGVRFEIWGPKQKSKFRLHRTNDRLHFAYAPFIVLYRVVEIITWVGWSLAKLKTHIWRDAYNSIGTCHPGECVGHRYRPTPVSFLINLMQ